MSDFPGLHLDFFILNCKKDWQTFYQDQTVNIIMEGTNAVKSLQGLTAKLAVNSDSPIYQLYLANLMATLCFFAGPGNTHLWKEKKNTLE